MIYYKRRDYAQALEDFTKALQLNPNLAAAYNNGLMFIISKRPTRRPRRMCSRPRN
jgi:tetratricopeptide (TPR) repeat protein